MIFWRTVIFPGPAGYPISLCQCVMYWNPFQNTVFVYDYVFLVSNFIKCILKFPLSDIKQNMNGLILAGIFIAIVIAVYLILQAISWCFACHHRRQRGTFGLPGVDSDQAPTTIWSILRDCLIGLPCLYGIPCKLCCPNYCCEICCPK